jgi:hypothetical protein
MKLIEAKGTWYHGSDEDFDSFDTLKLNSGFLGKGAYFYQDKLSAQTFGKNIYKLQNSKDFNTIPLDYSLNKNEVEGIATNAGLKFQSIKKDLPSGAFKPYWWFVEASNFYSLKRSKLLSTLAMIFSVKGFDSIIVDYPNGGLVLFIFDKIEDVELKL